MNLNKFLCDEIFIKENIWIEQIKNNLINVIYCDYELKPFYLKKRKILKDEYFSSNNGELLKLIKNINEILNKLEKLGEQYRSGLSVDISSLIPLFLINNKNNNEIKEDLTELDKLNIQNEVLKSIYRSSVEKSQPLEDYVYDDFPESNKKSL